MNNFSTFSRHARLSGTEYAASIEHKRRRDYSGPIIIVVCAFLTALPYLVIAIRS